jgi:hypothetical protein
VIFWGELEHDLLFRSFYKLLVEEKSRKSFVESRAEKKT